MLVRDFLTVIVLTAECHDILLESFSRKLTGLIKVEKFLKFVNNSDGIWRDSIYDTLNEMKIHYSSHDVYFLSLERCKSIIKLADDESFKNLIDTKLPHLKTLTKSHELEICFEEEVARWQHEAIHRFSLMLKKPVCSEDERMFTRKIIPYK